MRPSRLLILEIAALGACADPEGARREVVPNLESSSVVASATSAPARAAAPSAPASSTLGQRLRQLRGARYMEGRCRKGSFPGWEDFPLKRCRYVVPDVTGHKATEVILLNPSSKRLARWIESACQGGPSPCRDVLAERILWQSGAQFPVAGIVLEDMRPVDGQYEMYCFRDGVRVEVVGFETQSTERPTTAHFDSCVTGELVKPTSFARIAGTTPGEYLAAGGKEAVGRDGAPTARWLEVTRSLYQAAWRGDHNPLLDAWVAANVRRD